MLKTIENKVFVSELCKVTARGGIQNIAEKAKEKLGKNEICYVIMWKHAFTISRQSSFKN